MTAGMAFLKVLAYMVLGSLVLIVVGLVVANVGSWVK